MMGISTLAGLIATTAAVLAAYYGSTFSYRLGLDPDTYGIPIITAAVDLLGFMSLIIALIVFGLAGLEMRGTRPPDQKEMLVGAQNTPGLLADPSSAENRR